LASSDLPTPVGPEKMKLAMGRLGGPRGGDARAADGAAARSKQGRATGQHGAATAGDRGHGRYAQQSTQGQSLLPHVAQSDMSSREPTLGTLVGAGRLQTGNALPGGPT